MRIVLHIHSLPIEGRYTPALAAAGYRVVRATSGTEGVRTAIAEPPDVVVVPVALPDVSGAEVCRRLRRTAAGLPVLVIGPASDSGWRREALEAGATACLAEPVGATILVAQVSALVKVREPHGVPSPGEGDEQLRALLRLAERRSAELATIIESMPDAVYLGTADGITHCNTNALRMLGADSLEDMKARIGELGKKFSVRWPGSGRLLREDELQFTRALKGETVAEEVLATNAQTGTDVFIRSACAPIVQDGIVIGAVAINSDITGRRRAEEALREANVRLAEADQRKDDFLAVLSHELRNPLAPITYALPLLQREPLGESAVRALAVIGRQVGHLSRLVDDLLDVSRITRGKVELRCEHVTLNSILTAALEAASPGVAAGRHTVKVSVPGDPIWLHADPARLAQVVTNLLNNSAKYTPRDGEISLEAGRDDHHAVIRVRDTGIGIPADALPHVFEMFRQVGHPDQSQGGLGIGLALVKRLVEMHRGRIEAHSAGVGHGAEFVVHLPIAEGAIVQEADEISTVPGAGRRLKVLIVDDNPDLVEMLAAVVSALGHDVRKAPDGPSAISAALSYRPDVVLLDLGLPGLSGTEVARELRRQPETGNARLVALTGWGKAEDRLETSEAGFDRHLTKPADPGMLEQLLDEFAAVPSERPLI